MVPGGPVKQGNMRAGIKQAAPFKLPLNFNKQIANLSQQPD